MKIWVLDINVIVSAHLSPHGPPARLLCEVLAQRLRVAYDTRILYEYREVLLRPKFNLPPASVRRFLDVMSDHEFVTPRALALPDPKDVMFAEVAAALKNPLLVTGNLAHFPRELCAGVEVLSPADAWKKLSFI